MLGLGERTLRNFDSMILKKADESDSETLSGLGLSRARSGRRHSGDIGVPPGDLKDTKCK